MKICFATHNRNKLKEINQLVPENFEVLSLDDLGQTNEIPETGTTLDENSEIKARFVFEKYHLPVFADDSGLEVHSLDGAPGVYSARYAGSQKSSEDNMSKLLAELNEKADRSACFKSVITFIGSQGYSKQFVGRVDGEIINEKRGGRGFGYDPIFVPDGHDRTFAEMTDEEKNSLSHRAQALEKFLTFINSEK